MNEQELKDEQTLTKIAHRFRRMQESFGQEAQKVRVIVAFVWSVHRNHPLDLERLLKSRDMDFSHDVAGIMRNWDWQTCTFRETWSPRHTISRALVGGGWPYKPADKETSYTKAELAELEAEHALDMAEEEALSGGSEI